MSFKLETEQTEFQDSLRAFLEESVPSEYLRKRIGKSLTSDPELWQKLGSLGLMEYFATDESEETRPGFVELSVIAHESGRSLLPETLLDSILAGPYLLMSRLCKSDREAFLETLKPGPFESIVTGRSRVCIVPKLPEVSYVSLERKGGKLAVSGMARMVAGADAAEYALILAREGGGDEKLYLVDLESSDRNAESALDATIKLFRVALKSARCHEVPGVSGRRFRALVEAARACEMAGVCQKAVEMTRDYVKTRKQFGVPVGGFQAVQHILADMHLNAEALGSMSRFGAWSVDHSQEQIEFASSTAIGFACDYGPEIVENAIQMHGGIGFTWEYDLHLYLRRARSIAAIYARDAHDCDELLSLAGRAV